MSRDSSADDSPFDPSEYTADVPSFASGVPSPGPIAFLVVLLACLAFAWYARPWLQPLVYGLYTSPGFVLVGVLVLAVLAAISLGSGLPSRFTIRAVLVAGFVLVLVVSTVGGWYAGATLSAETMAGAQRSATLEESDPTSPRIVTRAVADRYASNTLQTPRYRVTGGDITVYNGTPYWSYALAPDGVRNRYTLDQNGTVLVDMTEQNADVDARPADIDAGIGTAWYNNYDWTLKKRGEYLANYHDPFMVIDPSTDEQYVAVPYTTPEFHWLPVPYTTPEWGGVALLDSNGSIEMLSPNEARAHPALREQKLYPFSLARKKVAATKYRNGILNTFSVIGSHRGEIELAEVPGEGTDQPFFVLSAKGPRYVVAVEPYGEAQGLREVWNVNPRTGSYERYVPNESLVGARKATDFVRQDADLSRLSWGSFTPAEPVPAVVDGQLYWEVRIVPNDGSGVSYVAFVNARNTDVRAFSTTAGVERFLRSNESVTGTVGTNASEGGDTANAGGPSRTAAPADGSGEGIVVQRVNENGTVVETVVIGPNESVRIVRSNGTSEGASGTNDGANDSAGTSSRLRPVDGSLPSASADAPSR
jgi:putative effector of murein hydrolase LrgA (UPF0299 family)